MTICLFDIDGTLLMSGGAGQAAMETALESTFGVTAATENIPVAGRTDRAITADMMRFHGVEETAANRERFRDEYLRHLPGELASRGGLVLPGVEPLIRELAVRSNLLMGLLTGNFRRGAELKLRHFGLWNFFRCGGYGDEHHSRDDVARAALADARRLDRDGKFKDVWVFGDTPADVQCGRAIGATVVAVATGHFTMEELERCEPDHLLEDFSDIELVLGILEPGEPDPDLSDDE